MEKVKIYTDGAVSGNGTSKSYGGWAFVVVTPTKSYHKNGSESPTTNQRMELRAMLEALKECSEKGYSATIYSDSAYLINCYQKTWYVNWISNGWKNSKKEPVANKDLWVELIPFFTDIHFDFQKVAGHAGDHYNELADSLARGAIKK